MPFTIMPKSASSPHVAAAEGAMEYHRQDSRSQMGQHAEQPISDEQAAELDEQHEADDDAAKAAQRHPASGRFVPEQIPSGVSHGPIVDALALHRPAQPLASLATVPGPARGALASSVASNPGAVNVAHLDYSQGSGPTAVNVSPIRPDFHQASNSPGVQS